MEITAEIKDQELQHMLEGGRVYTGKDKAIAAILYSDGYVNLKGTNMGDVCTLTSEGRAFIAQGGYSAVERAKVAEETKMQQIKFQEMEMQRLVSERLMEKDHEFQARQNKANRKNNIISGLIAAIISAIITLIMQAL